YTILLVIYSSFSYFFFNATPTTEIYTLSLHDALPISSGTSRTFYVDNLSATISADLNYATDGSADDNTNFTTNWTAVAGTGATRSEEHTSELQSLRHLVCRLLLEKKKKKKKKQKKQKK